VRRASALSICALVLAYASVAQGSGVNQLAHFSLVRSLSHGAARVDPYIWKTKDLSWYHGHYYSTKAPGLALLTVGPYFALDRSGVLGVASRVTGASREAVALWLLGLLGAVLPTGALLLLLRRVADQLEPGFGTVTAITAGVCTLLFPFATLFFDHALSTALGFAAFAALWHAGRRLWLVAVSGLLAGFAVTSEYPLALVAAALGLYAISEGDRIRRAAVYAAGVAFGVLPLLLYDLWAFGSPFHLSYADAIARRGVTGHDVLGQNAPGFFGVGTPNRGVAMHLLFGYIGLITITPVVIAGAVGLVLLWRKGRRREAALAAVLATAFLVYNSGYKVPFGGGTPGPRFLIPMLPFLALGFAAAYRAWPWATLTLAVPSGAIMLGVTATNPVRATTWAWVHRVFDGSFTGAGVGPKLPLALLVAAALYLCVRATPIAPPTPRQAIGAALALGGYVVIALAGPRLAGTDPKLLIALFVGIVAAVALWHGARWPHRRGRAEPTPGPG
jgi:hypothetical protein